MIWLWGVLSAGAVRFGHAAERLFSYNQAACLLISSQLSFARGRLLANRPVRERLSAYPYPSWQPLFCARRKRVATLLSVTVWLPNGFWTRRSDSPPGLLARFHALMRNATRASMVLLGGYLDFGEGPFHGKKEGREKSSMPTMWLSVGEAAVGQVRLEARASDTGRAESTTRTWLCSKCGNRFELLQSP
jgi:hypothetical protein